jgi:hypothetical protein
VVVVVEDVLYKTSVAAAFFGHQNLSDLQSRGTRGKHAFFGATLNLAPLASGGGFSPRAAARSQRSNRVTPTHGPYSYDLDNICIAASSIQSGNGGERCQLRTGRRCVGCGPLVSSSPRELYPRYALA